MEKNLTSSIDDDLYSSTRSSKPTTLTNSLASFITNSVEDDVYSTSRSSVGTPEVSRKSSMDSGFIALNQPLQDSADSDLYSSSTSVTSSLGSLSLSSAPNFKGHMLQKHLEKPETLSALARSIKLEEIQVNGCSSKFAYTALTALRAGASSSFKFFSCLNDGAEVIQDCPEDDIIVIKLIPVANRSDAADPGNVETKFISIFYDKIVKVDLSPHFMPLLAKFNCSGVVFSELTGVSALKESQYNALNVIITPKAKTDMQAYLMNSSDPNNLYFANLKKWIFQVLFTLAMVQEGLDGRFRHNDCHPGNILLAESNDHILYYKIGKNRYQIKWEDSLISDKPSLSVRVWDFEYSTLVDSPDAVKNNNINGEIGKIISASDRDCSSHDAHTFLNFLVMDDALVPFIPFERRSDPLFIELKNFVMRNYPSELLHRMNSIDTPTGKVEVVRSGRLTEYSQINYGPKLKSPAQLITEDKYFESYVAKNVPSNVIVYGLHNQ